MPTRDTKGARRPMPGGCPQAAPAARPTGTGDGRVSIEIANESGAEVDEAGLAALARHVLDGMRIHPLAELSVLLVDEPVMTELHVRWMGEPGPTDVLAFPMDELRPPAPATSRGDPAGGGEPGSVPGLLGDVLLCTHGILHLLGYDHADPEEHATMFSLQDKLLGSWRAERGSGRDEEGQEGP